MTCQRIPGGIVCSSPSYRLRLNDGRYVFMSWHRFYGPEFYYDKAEQRQIAAWWDDTDIINAINWFTERGQRA